MTCAVISLGISRGNILPSLLLFLFSWRLLSACVGSKLGCACAEQRDPKHRVYGRHAWIRKKVRSNMLTPHTNAHAVHGRLPKGCRAFSGRLVGRLNRHVIISTCCKSTMNLYYKTVRNFVGLVGFNTRLIITTYLNSILFTVSPRVTAHTSP